MRAVCWNGTTDVRVETVPDPQILNPRDAVIRVTSAAICGSDLHLYDGYIPSMKKGDILGHEFMGEVMEVGRGVKNLSVGDRVVVPFTIACGNCFFCKQELWSLCDNSNPNAVIAEKAYGYSPSGLFGYSHMTGGYAGGQAEYVRVPFADVGPLKIPDGMPDEKALFLGDIFPTGYMAAENCNIQPGDTVAVWGCGPVGQFAIQSCWMLGAERVIAIDRFPERLLMAQTWGRAEVIDYEQVDSVTETLREMTGGRGPDSCIDAVGMEAHGHSADALYDKAKQTLRMETDRPHVLREAFMACRKGGTVSIPGVYGGILDKVPLGAAFNKGLTLKMGQTHVMRYTKPLLDRIEAGEIDPSNVITHRLDLEDAPDGYETFKHKEDNCIKIVLKPHGNGHSHFHSHGHDHRHSSGMEGQVDRGAGQNKRGDDGGFH
jgi:threonine dehydrogenase-like Zn-dependent dehydrogenase